MSTIPTAQMVDNNLLKVQIPSGKYPGDTFTVKPAHGNPITITVPQGYQPGQCIDVVLSADAIPTSENRHGDVSETESTVTLNKTVVGAAVAGAVVGSCLLGPIFGICLGAGAAYAA
jgi:hypothetical protein